MKSLRPTISSTSFLVAGLLMSCGAFAQSTWNIYSGSSGGSGCSQNGSYSGNYNNSYNCTSTGTAGTQATASAWSADRGSVPTGPLSQAETDYLSGTGFASAYLSPQGNSGLGASSRSEGIPSGSPNHSFDSYSPGTLDALLLSFNTSVILDKVGIGWGSSDADITLMRWTGTSAPGVSTGSSVRTGDGHQNLTSNIYNSATPSIAGWQLVGSYADLVKDDSLSFGGTARNTSATQASSWWLISTFNTALNGGSTTCKTATGTTTCDAGNDGFKLNFVSTKLATTAPPSGNVPEPGSLALACVALAGVFRMRRRSPQRARIEM